jgi:hypothetical protein
MGCVVGGRTGLSFPQPQGPASSLFERISRSDRVAAFGHHSILAHHPEPKTQPVMVFSDLPK